MGLDLFRFFFRNRACVQISAAHNSYCRTEAAPSQKEKRKETKTPIFDHLNSTVSFKEYTYHISIFFQQYQGKNSFFMPKNEKNRVAREASN